MTLVVLAAGLGRRFGGPKQFFPIGPSGECLFHYSLYNAIKNGVTNLLLITRQEVLPQARAATEGLPVPTKIVLQGTPGGEPRGTADALLTALRNTDSKQMLMINADDYYGPDSFAAAQILAVSSPTAAAVPYLLANTLSPHGGVSRAICESSNGFLTSIVETHDLVGEGNTASGTQAGQKITLPIDVPVSMNMFLFDACVTPNLDNYVRAELRSNPNQEVTIPGFLNHEITTQLAQFPIRNSTADWFGMTFAEDLMAVKDRLVSMHQSGQLPSRLW